MTFSFVNIYLVRNIPSTVLLTKMENFFAEARTRSRIMNGISVHTKPVENTNFCRNRKQNK